MGKPVEGVLDELLGEQEPQAFTARQLFALPKPVDEADAMPLVGMLLMYGYELLLPILDGATFQLHRIAAP